MVSNKKIGNYYEILFLELLKQKGYWSHLTGGISGTQPCDIIAIKNDKPILLDVKHCKTNTFSLERREANQQSSFTYAISKGITRVGYAIYFDKINKWKWMPHNSTLNHYNDMQDIEEIL